MLVASFHELWTFAQPTQLHLGCVQYRLLGIELYRQATRTLAARFPAQPQMLEFTNAPGDTTERQNYFFCFVTPTPAFGPRAARQINSKTSVFRMRAEWRIVSASFSVSPMAMRIDRKSALSFFWTSLVMTPRQIDQFLIFSAAQLHGSRGEALSGPRRARSDLAGETLDMCR
jgi:hypothetical protein